MGWMFYTILTPETFLQFEITYKELKTVLNQVEATYGILIHNTKDFKKLLTYSSFKK